MTSKWHVDELTPADYEPSLRLWNASPGVNANETPEEFSRMLVRNPAMSFAARVGARLVGALLCGHDGHRGCLYHLAVEPEYRNQGVARDLVDRSLSRLQDEGIRRVSIHVFAENEGGTAFWRRIGWRERPNVMVLSKDL